MRRTVVVPVVPLVFFFSAMLRPPKLKSLLSQTVKLSVADRRYLGKTLELEYNETMLETLMIEAQLVGGVAAGLAVWRTAAAYRLRFGTRRLEVPKEALPSVSVCIPARNETKSMTAALERALASQYPKLEILVLDDNSDDDTGELIRAFAHAGVRFLEGTPPPAQWLGKNFALQRLLDEASGRYILFLDVDTQLSPQTIGLLVQKMLSERLTMLSVIPQRRDWYRASAWLGSVRHWWEMLLHRSTTRPGACSSAWMVHRQRLLEHGGIARHQRAVQPERLIAEELAGLGEYALCISTPDCGVMYEKRWSSQAEASRRVMALRLGESFGAGMLGLTLFVAYGVWLSGVLSVLLDGWSVGGAVSHGVGLLLMTAVGLYYGLVWARFGWLGWLLTPYILLQEIVLFSSSVIGYRRGTVAWKGRMITPRR